MNRLARSILSDFAGVSFGTMSPVNNQPCPVSDFEKRPDAWEAWCGCMWPPEIDPAANAKCNAKNFLNASAYTPPWTSIGAGARHITWPGQQDAWIGQAVFTALDPGKFFEPKVTGPGQVIDANTGAPMGTAQGGVAAVPKVALAVAGGALLLGVGLLLAVKRKKRRRAAAAAAASKPAVAGIYRRKRRRR